MLNHNCFLPAAVAAALTCATPTAWSFTCDSDIDDTGTVDVLDLIDLLSQWGPCPDCTADIDGSGEVDVLDLLTLLSDWGPCKFDYGPPHDNPEAEQIGLEMLGPSGPLLLPDMTYDRVERDLDLIRADYPELAAEFHNMAWAPNQLIIKLIAGEPLDDYAAHNVYYQVIDEDHLFGDWYTLTYIGNMNVLAMAQIYAAIDAVEYAEPNGLIGGQNFWSPSDLGDGLWRWEIDDGWMDCFDGCDCHRYYVIDVEEDGRVTLISYEEVGMPWCEFDR